MNLENWLIDHITNNPNITYGSLYRDICLSKIGINSYDDSLNNALSKLKKEGLIIKTSSDFNNYYNLGKQLDRDNKIDKLLNNE